MPYDDSDSVFEATRERLPRVANVLSSLTKQAWVMEVSHRDLYLVSESGLRLRVRYEEPKRLHIWASYPRELWQHLPYKDSRQVDSIKLSASKSDVRVAGEIVERLLPGYIANELHAREMEIAQRVEKEFENAVVERLAAIIEGVRITDRDRDSMFWDRFSGTHPSVRGRVNWRYGVDMELRHLHPDAAAAILEIVAAHPAFKP